MSSGGYMMEPPHGQHRFAAGNMRVAQVTIGAIFFTCASVVYGMRIYTRTGLMKHAIRFDDYLAGASLLSCWVFFACTMGMVAEGGCGRDFWQVTQPQYESLLKWTIPVNIFYMLSSDLAKLSLLLFYYRLCPEKTFRILVRVLIACFVSYAIIYALISLFGCQPIYAAWDLAAQATGKCIDKFHFFLAASVANVVMDLIILLLPLRIVMPLQIPRRQKVSLGLLFGTGGFVIFMATYNCVLTVRLFSSANYTWGLGYELCWMYAELTGCVVCASASSLKPLFVRLLPSIFGSRVAGYSHGSIGMTPKAGSLGTRSRKHLSLRAADAIELGSADDGESTRKQAGGYGDEEEARLWTSQGVKGAGKGDGVSVAAHTVQVSAQNSTKKGKRAPKPSLTSRDRTDSFANAPGIHVAWTTQVSRSDSP